MNKRSAQLFKEGNEDASFDNVQLTVNDDFARKLQVRISFYVARLRQRQSRGVTHSILHTCFVRPTFTVCCSITNKERSCTVCKRSILRVQSRQRCKALGDKYHKQRLLNGLTAQKTRMRSVKPPGNTNLLKHRQT